MNRRLSQFLAFAIILSVPFLASAATKSTTRGATLSDRLKGSILLQVQQHGEAWYVRPNDGQRYYMPDGTAAYQMMRGFSLGITNDDLARIPSVSGTDEMKNSTSICVSNPFADSLRGQILLQVQKHGEAWYVDPNKCRSIYMADGSAAYQIMRYLGLGISDSDLSAISPGTIGQQATIPSPTPASPSVSAASPESASPPQTIAGLTGLSFSSQLTANGLEISYSYFSGDSKITDADAYLVPVTATITVNAEGYDAKKSQRMTGVQMFSYDYADSDITHGTSERVITVPFDKMKGVLASVIPGIVTLSVSMPAQGTFSGSAYDVPLASSPSPSNEVQLSGSFTSSDGLSGITSVTEPFYLLSGSASIQENNSGEYSNVFMWLVAEKDLSKTLIVNEVGNGSRQYADMISDAGWYYVQVQSPGPWNLDIQQGK